MRVELADHAVPGVRDENVSVRPDRQIVGSVEARLQCGAAVPFVARLRQAGQVAGFAGGGHLKEAIARNHLDDPEISPGIESRAKRFFQLELRRHGKDGFAASREPGQPQESETGGCEERKGRFHAGIPNEGAQDVERDFGERRPCKPVSSRAMTQAPQIRTLLPEDLPVAEKLRELAGWNQTREDWQRFLDMEPEGCFLAEWEGRPVGTATTLRYGRELAWIGMVLVHPEERRRGVGSALLRHAIAWLRSREVRCIKLDATPAGKLVYDALGFRDEWDLHRWEHRGLFPGQLVDQGLGRRAFQAGDVVRVAALDTRGFGVSREPLLFALAQQSRGVLIEDAQGRVLGYGFVRPGTRASYLGPVVAETGEAGSLLVESLLALVPGAPVFWDVPEGNAVAVAQASRLGFARQRLLTRMFLGENGHPGEPSLIYGLAAPEVG